MSINQPTNENVLKARDNIIDAACVTLVCSQALGSLAASEMPRLIYDTIRGCETLLNGLNDKLIDTDNLLKADVVSVE